MKEIVDNRGNLVNGLLRSPTGAIVVRDPVALAKYTAQKELASRVSKTERDIEEIHSMLKTLIEKLDK